MKIIMLVWDLKCGLCNSVHNANSVQRLHVHKMSHVIFFYSPVNNALSPLHDDVKETLYK